MIDGFGRNIDYLRISVTDRCDLRCIYCMPEEGVPKLPHDAILHYEDMVRLVRVFAGLGFQKIKLTGGEPLCARNIDYLVGEIKQVPGIEQVTMTTNAVQLDQHLLPLYEAGLDAMNISLDTMDRDLFERLTRRDKFPEVLDNIRQAAEFGKIPLKVNVVPMTREQKLWDVAELARDYPIAVRFIELMPIGTGKEYDGFTREDTVELLTERFGPLTPYAGTLGNGPAEYFSLNGFAGKIGFISAISHKFCDSCNRVRLTSTGFLKTCLQYDTGEDLLKVIRAGGTDEELEEAICKALAEKPRAHHFDMQDGSMSVGDEVHGMSQIGG